MANFWGMLQRACLCEEHALSLGLIKIWVLPEFGVICPIIILVWNNRIFHGI
ncbi:42774_t:CDS:2 [Gigaspora margarita]|uniref:42774_t:CDS:1 n=1 Tax=Gigaspora margarita TaxID=4874 RepID=A0ABN7UFI3_GIGMA|nr:42774_t:CDS:2 [Gigaspora margarita]